MTLKEHTQAAHPAKLIPHIDKPRAVEAESTPRRPHTDYDLQPLRVSSLDHYVEADASDRFDVH